MLLDLTLIVAGVALLAFSGDRLIDFSAALAEKARLTPAVIGLTVVAAGTSAPELFVSATAALRGSPTIALGNVVGSNIANVALILGVCAVLAPIPVTSRSLRFEYPFMLAASVALWLVAYDGCISRAEAAGFLLAMAAFLGYSVSQARRVAAEDWTEERLPAHAHTWRDKPTAWLLGGLLLGFIGLAGGAELLVRGAVSLARSLGVTERVIALTVVAIGTSLPELFATSSAALKRQHEMAVASIVGSNIFNVLLILGVTGVIRPVPAVPRLVNLDTPVMLGFAMLLWVLIARSSRLGRAAGLTLLAPYWVYITWVVARS